MALEYLDASVFESSAADVLKSIDQFDYYIKRIKGRTDFLLENWQGEAKEAFENDYMEIFLKLKDMRESMYELREDLINAGAIFEEADLTIGKKISEN